MLTDQDITKLTAVLATKQDVQDLKEELVGLKETVQALSIAVDKLIKAIDDLRQEYIAITSQVNRHEKWLQQIADKVGIKLEY